MRSLALVLVLGFAVLGCGDEAPGIADAPADGTAIDAAVDAPIDATPIVCATLGPLACRSTPACAADFCTDCDCAPAFTCRDATAQPTECPILDCPSPSCCHDKAECDGQLCVTPSDPPRCGICQNVRSQCATDLDCQAGTLGGGAVLVCDPVPCACSPANQCVPGCSADVDCGDARTCDVPTGRCQPRACSAAAPCPPDFDCTAGGCQRRTCSSDAVCDGFCAEGLCRESLGTCSLPPA